MPMSISVRLKIVAQIRGERESRFELASEPASSPALPCTVIWMAMQIVSTFSTLMRAKTRCVYYHYNGIFL